MSRQRSMWLVLFVLIATSPACSFNRTETPPAPPAATSGPQSPPTPTLPATLPSAAPVTIPPTESPAPTETLAPTATPTPTLKPRQPVVTLRPRQTTGPLTVNYEVVEINREPGDQATLVLRVIATGGGGGYRYYHDDVQQAGATFNVAGRCGRPFVHTIKVTSASGQTVSLSYFVRGVCPTPTPTPKS